MPKFEHKIDIKASVETVWSVMADPAQWPHWFPGVESVANLGNVAAGTAFDWTDQGKTGTASIVHLEAPHRLVVDTKLGDDEDVHTFTLKPHGGILGMGAHGAEVDYVLDTKAGGGILGGFLMGGNPKDTLRVKHALDQLKHLSEQAG